MRPEGLARDVDDLETRIIKTVDEIKARLEVTENLGAGHPEASEYFRGYRDAAEVVLALLDAAEGE